MNYKKIWATICITAQLLPQQLFSVIRYEDMSQFSTTAPGYNKPDDDPKFHGVQPILFTPEEDVVTGDDSNKNQVGYFWDVKDDQNDLQFTGKARIGNSQYINVVAVDAKNINTTGDAYDLISTDEKNLYHPSAAEKKKFDPQYLVKIGTFMKKNDPTTYILFGRYLATIMPDPKNVEIT